MYLLQSGVTAELTGMRLQTSTESLKKQTEQISRLEKQLQFKKKGFILQLVLAQPV
jgi:hypothetical protein